MQLAATAVGIATLATTNTFRRTLSALAVGAAALTRIATYRRALSAVAAGIATLTTATEGEDAPGSWPAYMLARLSRLSAAMLGGEAARAIFEKKMWHKD